MFKDGEFSSCMNVFFSKFPTVKSLARIFSRKTGLDGPCRNFFPGLLAVHEFICALFPRMIFFCTSSTSKKDLKTLKKNLTEKVGLKIAFKNG